MGGGLYQTHKHWMSMCQGHEVWKLPVSKDDDGDGELL